MSLKPFAEGFLFFVLFCPGNKKSAGFWPADFGFYSLFLLELSDLLVEPPVLSDLLTLLELSDLLSLPELSDEADLLEPSAELLALSDELPLEPSLPSAFADMRPWPEGDLWSVAYQPEPLKIIPAGVSTLRRLFLLHSGQRFRGSSLKD